MSSQPSLLFVLNSLGVGGSEIKIIKVANALVRSGTAVELAYLNPVETSLSMIDPAVPVTCLDRRGKYSFSSLRRLGELVNRERQTVVAVNPYPLLYVVPAVKWCKLSNIKCVGLVNSMDLFGRERMYGRLFAQFLRRCDQIVFGCMAQQMHWVKKYGLPLERSLIIYNGVDHEYYSPTIRAKEGILLRQQLQIPENAVVVGSIGRLAPVKNYDKLIIALANLSAAGREAYAILGGEGADREKLERLAAAKGVAGRVKFLGVLRDVRSAMSAMDIFVLPSASETFSNAALEAMAMARAVVLSEAGGAAEMVEHGESGLLFDVGDVDALSESLVILHNSRELRERLGAAARKRVIAAFGSEDMVDCYRRLSQST
jgi:glycosyltransferase involved in cell wall biosynthesis